jgi:hypothetical protein
VCEIKMQREIEEEKLEAEEEWVKDETHDDDGEVIKLGVGESISGILLDKFPSIKYNTSIYKIKDKNDDKIKIIIGTTVLDKLMQPKEIGELVKIKRLEDGKSQRGVEFQNWETFHLHRSSSK